MCLGCLLITCIGLDEPPAQVVMCSISICIKYVTDLILSGRGGLALTMVSQYDVEIFKVVN